MKKVLVSLLVVSTSAMLFTACKKEPLSAHAEGLTPTPTLTSTTGGGGTGIVPLHVITRFGTDSVLYGADGRVATVQHGGASFTQYSYGNNTVTAKTYNGGALKEEIIYTLNPATGLAQESEWRGTIIRNGLPAPTQQWHKYEYNDNGRIKKKYNKFKPVDHTDFSWTSNGNYMARIRMYANDVEYRSVFSTEGSILSRLRMHEESTGLDIYLKIFGKGNKHLVNSESTWATTSNGASTHETDYHYSYDMNAAGYPVNRSASGGPAVGGPHPVLFTPYAYALIN